MTSNIYLEDGVRPAAAAAAPQRLLLSARALPVSSLACSDRPFPSPTTTEEEAHMSRRIELSVGVGVLSSSRK